MSLPPNPPLADYSSLLATVDDWSLVAVAVAAVVVVVIAGPVIEVAIAIAVALAVAVVWSKPSLLMRGRKGKNEMNDELMIMISFSDCCCCCCC